MNTDSINYKRPINFGWLLQMAWRDSRKNRSRLFLFISSIVLGIASLVAIYSFGFNLRQDIDRQAAELVGADIVISGNKPLSPQIQSLVDSLGDRKSTQRSFVSMALFTKNQGTRFVEVRALQGDFPYYGSIETTPASAATTFRKKQQVLADRNLMLQFNAHPGDSIKIGKVTFAIAGILDKAPGQTSISASVAPVIYMPLSYLEQTGLMQRGSRINYSYYIKYDRKENIEKLTTNIEPRLDKEDLSLQTVASQKEQTSRSFEDLTHFLALVGFVALLLGCIGVASSIHIYVREKLKAIAIMRCLGVKSTEAFLIYLIQIVIIGFIGSVLGAVLGTLVQQILPIAFKDFLPIEITVEVSWASIGTGILLGVVISLLFALLPLVSVRNISPLNTLRVSDESVNQKRDPLKWLVYLLIVAFITVFTYLQLNSWKQALSFTAFVLLAFFVLTGIATLIMWLLRKFLPLSWSYLWRQGFANLYRPNNQTIILLVSIGLGTAFISTLFFIQSILLSRINLSSGGNQPNLILFDIQSNQQQQVVDLTKQQHLPVFGMVPIVTIRLEELNGKNAAFYKKDTSKHVSRQVFSREYRVSYRDSLVSSEKITAGNWIGKADPAANNIPISIEEKFAQHNHIKIGDKLLFNVQGVNMETHIASFRKVNWNRIQTNFLVLFPKGVLEQAPQYFVFTTHVPSTTASAKYQQAVVKQFPNVSIIDLALVLKLLDDILGKISFVIRFMAGFSILTGLIVLVSSVLISKYQRIQESVLLRTLGASKRQILIITGLEYFFLGSIAALTGILISVPGSWALAKYSFDTAFSPPLLPVVILFFVVALITVLIGLFNSRGILNKPPLEVLRSDV
ncbi:FtsX-like permease family protein [uncultured Mucilaginibacter sp.]|uniref:ABC transporter permease n=1 Tax=uncultured Mucilaginibacter sp. TaxID=797541 RepID=UPI00260F2DEB|nr:FtsX-like permease family protein [uncultured Mucilaginibacter sp.]